MAQLVKCLPHRMRSQVQIPASNIKAESMADLRAHLPIAEPNSGETLSQNIRWRGVERYLSGQENFFCSVRT